MIRILVVDDHPMLRDGVSALVAGEPDMELSGEAEGGEEAVHRYRNLRPDVTLMDLQMRKGDGLTAIREIRELDPGAKIIVLTTYTGDVQASRALKAGVMGYLLKSALRRELLDTIRQVHAGRRRIPSEVAQEIALHMGEEPLTDRELEALQCVSRGFSNKRIARELLITEDTVKTHLRSVFFKLGVGDRTEAVVVAVRRGIIEV